MNPRTLLNPRSIACMITLMVGSAGIVAVNSAIVQSSEKPLQMAQSPTPIAGSWRLANMTEGGLPTPMVPVSDLTADFAEGRISGSGGCNRFNGGFTAKGDQLNIGPLASTFKACPEPIMQQEATYLKALQGAQRYEMNDDGLQIFYQSDRGSGVLRFTAQTVRGLW